MKKLVRMGALLSILALILMLTIGSAGAQSLTQDGDPDIPGEVEIEPEPGAGEAGEAEPEPEAEEPAEGEPSGTATRIDFELSDDVAREGLYVVQEAGGRYVASWYALDGWEDSGWMSNLNITGEAAHVQVLYYPGPETEPEVMKILNPAGGTEYGWLAEGTAHALEVEWAD